MSIRAGSDAGAAAVVGGSKKRAVVPEDSSSTRTLSAGQGLDRFMLWDAVARYHAGLDDVSMSADDAGERTPTETR
jgi:hypothetical protein